MPFYRTVRTMKAFLQKGKKIPEPFPEPFTTALNKAED
jgi:hypothetical protein